jgi:hypothetical protein
MVFTGIVFLVSYSKGGNTFLTSPEKHKMGFSKTSDIVEAAVIELGRSLGSTKFRIIVSRMKHED